MHGSRQLRFGFKAHVVAHSETSSDSEEARHALHVAHVYTCLDLMLRLLLYSSLQCFDAWFSVVHVLAGPA
jgi:hypothetical protein